MLAVADSLPNLEMHRESQLLSQCNTQLECFHDSRTTLNHIVDEVSDTSNISTLSSPSQLAHKLHAHSDIDILIIATH